MPPKLPGDAVTVFWQENPKKMGSKAYTRYEQYKCAKTVDEAVALGAGKADLLNDHKLGYLALPGQPGEPQAPGSAPELLEEADTRRGVKRAAQDGGHAAASIVALPSWVKRPVMEAPDPAGVGGPAAGARPAVVAPPKPPARETATPSTSAEAAPASTASDVDLSFTQFDNKPMKFIKRTMGEARKLLCSQGIEEGKKQGCEFRLLDRANLAKWAVQVRDLNPDGKLFQDLKQMGLDPCVDLEFSLPDGFPLEPPFARIVYPQLKGGYVFEHGGICFEPLTAKGWAPSMTLPALAIAIKGILDFGGVRCCGAGDRKARVVRHYTEDGARRDHGHIASAHRDGEGSTYGSLKHYKS